MPRQPTIIPLPMVFLPKLEFELTFTEAGVRTNLPLACNLAITPQQFVFTVFVARPTQRASVEQGLFLGGSGRRVVAQTRPAFPKMPTAPSAFPLLEASQAPGN